MAKRPKTGGRKPGTPNKVVRPIKLAAQEYGPEAIGVLYTIMSNRRAPPQARISAARELLDRGYGKAPQAITGADGGPLAFIKTVQHVHEPATPTE